MPRKDTTKTKRPVQAVKQKIKKVVVKKPVVKKKPADPNALFRAMFGESKY